MRTSPTDGESNEAFTFASNFSKPLNSLIFAIAHSSPSETLGSVTLQRVVALNLLKAFFLNLRSLEGTVFYSDLIIFWFPFSSLFSVTSATVIPRLRCPFSDDSVFLRSDAIILSKCTDRFSS